MENIKDNCNVLLGKADIDNLFIELNKELRKKKLKKQPKGFKANLYVVGGACVVATMGTRKSTYDIDAIWDIGSDMIDAINAVADRLGLRHDWCNCDFKRTKSYTDKIVYNSSVYAVYDRLIVRMVKPKLLLAMKLVAFRGHKLTDMRDCNNLINMAKQSGIVVSKKYLYGLVKGIMEALIFCKIHPKSILIGGDCYEISRSMFQIEKC